MEKFVDSLPGADIFFHHSFYSVYQVVYDVRAC